MTRTAILVQQAMFMNRVENMTAFLCAARDAIFATGHNLTEAEKSGFCLCMEALRENIRRAANAEKMATEGEI